MTTQETGRDEASSEGTVTVMETGSGTYTQEVTIGHHRLLPTSHVRSAMTQGQHPTIWYWPASEHAPP